MGSEAQWTKKKKLGILPLGGDSGMLLLKKRWKKSSKFLESYIEKEWEVWARNWVWNTLTSLTCTNSVGVCSQIPISVMAQLDKGPGRSSQRAGQSHRKHQMNEIGVGVKSRNFYCYHRASSHWLAGRIPSSFYARDCSQFCPLQMRVFCHCPLGLKALL